MARSKLNNHLYETGGLLILHAETRGEFRSLNIEADKLFNLRVRTKSRRKNDAQSSFDHRIISFSFRACFCSNGRRNHRPLPEKHWLPGQDSRRQDTAKKWEVHRWRRI